MFGADRPASWQQARNTCLLREKRPGYNGCLRHCFNWRVRDP